MAILLSIAVFLALLAEGTLIALPLVLLFLLPMLFFTNRTGVLVVGFVAGLLLDVFLFRPFGATSLFFLLVFSLFTLYDRKFETKSYPFFLFLACVSLTSYGFLFHLPFAIYQMIVLACILGLISFPFFRYHKAS